MLSVKKSCKQRKILSKIEKDGTLNSNLNPLSSTKQAEIPKPIKFIPTSEAKQLHIQIKMNSQLLL